MIEVLKKNGRATEAQKQGSRARRTATGVAASPG